MADIQMRFGKDMLVLSTAFNHIMKQQNFNPKTDESYIALCEPEVIEQAYQLEKMIGTPCFVTATDCITNARLAHAKFEGRGAAIAEIAWDVINSFKPEHALAAIGPTGLPLDESSAASLKANKKQYQDAVAELAKDPFDAIFFSGFGNAYDAQCALMGARAVYDDPLFLSFALDDEGNLLSRSHSLEEAVALAAEYGADVIGITSGARIEKLQSIIESIKAATDKPILVELEVRELIERALNPDKDNPYYSPDTMVDAALKLHSWGVQFVRAAGMASPAYTGALVATLSGLDVVN